MDDGEHAPSLCTAHGAAVEFGKGRLRRAAVGEPRARAGVRGGRGAEAAKGGRRLRRGRGRGPAALPYRRLAGVVNVVCRLLGWWLHVLCSVLFRVCSVDVVVLAKRRAINGRRLRAFAEERDAATAAMEAKIASARPRAR